MKICVIGAGYVGLVTAAGLAGGGKEVTCVDKLPEKIELLKKGQMPFYEPGLKELVEKGRINFTCDLKSTLKSNQVFFVCVGTPSLTNGQIDLSQVHEIVKEIYAQAKDGSMVVMKSTVSPGTGLKLIREMGRDSIVYVSNPEFLREGQAISDWFHPDRIIIGSSNQQAAKLISALYKNIDAPIVSTDITSAEIIKYASNAYLTVKVSFINEIANLCELIGANIDDVAHGIGLDKRIGSSFLKAGLGYGGSCFPKDTRGLDFLSAQYGCNLHLLSASIRVNANQKFRVIQKLLSVLSDLHGKRIALYGLSFKPQTDDVRESIAFELINIMLKEGATVQAYDPIAADNAKKIIPPGDRLTYSNDAYLNAQGCQALVLATEWPEFAKLSWEKLKGLMVDPYLLIDGRNFLDPHKMRACGFQYQGIGR